MGVSVTFFSRYKAIALFMLLSGVCRADLDFRFVDGADNAVESVLVAHRQAATAAGRITWLWGSLIWSDPSGSYAYFSYHGYGTGFLFKRNRDGTYSNISPAQPNSTTDRPAENRPLLMDADNNGFVDILHTGDETLNSVSLLNKNGSWQFSRSHRLGWHGTPKDVNNDSYLDVVGFTAKSPYGTGAFRTLLNLAGTGFSATSVPVVMPAGCPQEVVDRVAVAKDRYHMPRVFHLDAATYIVTYGGSYSGQKFTYVIRDNQVVDIGIPRTGTAHRPLDVDGNGSLDVVMQWGDSAGVYRQTAGVFGKDTKGSMQAINAALKTGAYLWDVWPIDLDGDSDFDLVMSSKRSGKGYILDNRSGIYMLYETINHVDGEAMWPGDADGDGDIDVVFAGGSARNGDQAGFYINQKVVEGEKRPNFQ